MDLKIGDVCEIIYTDGDENSKYISIVINESPIRFDDIYAYNGVLEFNWDADDIDVEIVDVLFNFPKEKTALDELFKLRPELKL